jgi:Zn finger protein HypA/HybF involved in hydrogenase expression
MILLENNYGKLRCLQCDSVMKIEPSDINVDCDNELYVICPVCNSKIWGTNNIVVKRIKDGILYHK